MVVWHVRWRFLRAVSEIPIQDKETFTDDCILSTNVFIKKIKI
jgi:hypothetical protein